MNVDLESAEKKPSTSQKYAYRIAEESWEGISLSRPSLELT